VTGAAEPAPEWHAVWRFRVVALVLLAVLAWGTAWAINQALHLGNQDPTNDVNPSAPASPGP
jgi:hypothetical protein